MTTTLKPSAASASSLPPGPRQSGFWQLLRYSLWAPDFLEDCHRRFGDPFTIDLFGHGKLVLLSSPDAVRDVFRGDPAPLHSGEGNEFLSLSVGRNSVLVLDGQPHARQRRVLLPPLKGERMRSFFSAMQQATLDVAETGPESKPIRMDEPMRQITLRVILQAVLGLPVDEPLRTIEQIVHRLLKHSRSRWSLFTMRMISPEFARRNARRIGFFRELARLDVEIYRLIARRRQLPAEQQGDDVLAALLAARHEEGEPLADEEIRDAIVTMLVAGHETTSVALCWALEQIARRPEVVERLQSELRGTFGDELPSPAALDQLSYLDAAIRESLRVRTILPFVVRKTKRPFAAGGREFPEGVLLAPCSHLIHRRADLYPEPEAFRPERFLERKFSPYEWFPFGGGNRLCLGMPFAMYEMQVVLSSLLTRFTLARPAEWRSRYTRKGIVLAPDDGARVVMTRRSRAF